MGVGEHFNIYHVYGAFELIKFAGPAREERSNGKIYVSSVPEINQLVSGEQKPHCDACVRQGETCDYSIRLNWGGRTKRDSMMENTEFGPSTANSPYQSLLSFEDVATPLLYSQSPERPPSRRRPIRHGRSQSANSIPKFEPEVRSDLVSWFKTSLFSANLALNT